MYLNIRLIFSFFSIKKDPRRSAIYQIAINQLSFTKFHAEWAVKVFSLTSIKLFMLIVPLKDA